MEKNFLFSMFCCLSIVCYSQQDSVELAPYQRFPTIPPLKLLTIDSTTYFTSNDLKKNKPVLIMLFNPDCDHCKHETIEILENINQLEDVEIVMATTMPLDAMRSFYERYNLRRFDNIHVGQDRNYSLTSFYQNHLLPYLAMYDKQGKLLITFEGSRKIDDLVNAFK
jgi:thiol-disulfide isomerase/thioredoxin